jgi:hypothetical protein
LAAATAAGKSALGLGTRFINIEGSAIEITPVEGADCVLAFSIVGHFDESKTSGLPGVTISNDVHAVNCAMRLKQRTDGLFGGPETKVAYKNVFHFTLLSEFAE